MKIEITEEDINNGQRGHPTRCALAKAVGRTLDKLVSVTDTSITVYKGDEFKDSDIIYHINTPREMMQFIHDFDKARESTKPTIFELDTEDLND